MSDVVSARRLRKSLLREIDGNIDIDDNFRFNTNKEKTNYKEKNIEKEKSNIKINSFKNKLLFKCFFSLSIIFICLVCKLCFKEQILSNKYCNILIKEYNYDYNKEEILQKTENFSKKYYNTAKYIIPENILQKIEEKYVSNIKPYIYNFYLKDELKKVINKISEKTSITTNNTNINVSESSNNIEEVLNGKGGGEPIIAEASLIEDSSAISIMQDDINQIISKNINIISPLSGVITSTYGAREQIFEGVNSYHTGIDIAAKTGTEIKSATSGKVIKIKENDKYYGNYVIIETNGVNFKYAHMSKIKVKINDKVEQNSIVGLVGNTGMSTGPHLHFEISINSRTVNPQYLINF